MAVRTDRAPRRPRLPAASRRRRRRPAPAPAGAADAGTKPAVGPGGTATADTQGLTQFETGGRLQAARGGDDKVAFSLEDADLPELVRVIGELTGKRFIFGGKVHNIKATVFSPQKVTVAEAYQAFLSILEANGLTVVPHGRFYKIVDSPDAKMGAPVIRGRAGGDRRGSLHHADPSRCATRAPTRSRTCSVTSSRRTATSPSTAPATCSSSRTPARTSSA